MFGCVSLILYKIPYFQQSHETSRTGEIAQTIERYLRQVKEKKKEEERNKTAVTGIARIKPAIYSEVCLQGQELPKRIKMLLSIRNKRCNKTSL